MGGLHLRSVFEVAGLPGPTRPPASPASADSPRESAE
jgi:hypothetical protein